MWMPPSVHRRCLRVSGLARVCWVSSLIAPLIVAKGAAARVGYARHHPSRIRERVDPYRPTLYFATRASRPSSTWLYQALSLSSPRSRMVAIISS